VCYTGGSILPDKMQPLMSKRGYQGDSPERSQSTGGLGRRFAEELEPVRLQKGE
jgi:hypothetical protein